MERDPSTEERHSRYGRIPEPVPRAVTCPIISVDDHILEPPDLFASRLPRSLQADAPTLLDAPDGEQYWVVDGERLPLNMMSIASVGVPFEERRECPIRYDEVRAGVLNPSARIRDMDLAGVAASLNFPSTIFGFAGWRFAALKNADAGRACVDAYNDWIHEVWCEPHPERFIGQQIVWLGDAAVAAAQIRRNAARGFKAVSFVESPHRFGLPSLYTRAWDPFFAACEETDTVVDLHVGSGGFTLVPGPDTPPSALALIFPANAVLAAVDWLFAGVTVRFPRLKIAFSEAGIGWVPMILERLSRLAERSRFEATPLGGAVDGSVGAELLRGFRENYWFTTLGEPIAFGLRDYIGCDRIMFECDYPHSDTLWPDVQETLEESSAGLDGDTRARIAYGNAAELYRHPLPAAYR